MKFHRENRYLLCWERSGTGYTDMTIFICISITLWRLEFAEKAKGELIINEHTYTYQTNSVTLIPPNIPHTTISNGMVRNSWEFLYVDVNHVMEELYGDRIAQKK